LESYEEDMSVGDHIFVGPGQHMWNTIESAHSWRCTTSSIIVLTFHWALCRVMNICTIKHTRASEKAYLAIPVGLQLQVIIESITNKKLK